MTDLQPRWLSASEAARYLGVGTSTFYRLKKDGKVPEPVSITDRLHRYDRHAIDRALAGDHSVGLESRSSDADNAFKDAARGLAKAENG